MASCNGLQRSCKPKLGRFVSSTKPAILPIHIHRSSQHKTCWMPSSWRRCVSTDGLAMAACQCHKVWWILQFYDCIWSYHVWFRMYQCNIHTFILYMFLQRRCLHSPPRLSRTASGKLGSFMFFLDPSTTFFLL
jgi:hypothetical protein